MDAGGLLQRVFNGVLGEGAIAVDGAPFGQVEIKDVQGNELPRSKLRGIWCITKVLAD